MTDMQHYLRTGAIAHLPEMASDGGHLVPSSLTTRVMDILRESSPMRRIASVGTISSDSMVVNGKSIHTHEMYAQPKATHKLLDDSAIDVEQWLVEKVADTFSRLENTAFISGNGVNQPRGILTYSAKDIEQIESSCDGAVTSDSLIKMYYALKEEYATYATFLMNRATLQSVRMLKDPTTGKYLWQPGLMAGAPDTLMGVPVIPVADMPMPEKDSLAVAIGDFLRAYQIVDRTGIRVLRDPFTEKPFVKFYTTKRTGGDVVNFGAIKLLKL